MLRTIGQALLVRQRMAGRIEIEEKPDVLWDNPQVERLHARLADEYELKERATALTRKLRVIDETTHALTDLIDTERSMRLEATIVALIVVEILIAFYDLFWRATWTGGEWRIANGKEATSAHPSSPPFAAAARATDVARPAGRAARHPAHHAAHRWKAKGTTSARSARRSPPTICAGAYAPTSSATTWRPGSATTACSAASG